MMKNIKNKLESDSVKNGQAKNIFQKIDHSIDKAKDRPRNKDRRVYMMWEGG